MVKSVPKPRRGHYGQEALEKAVLEVKEDVFSSEDFAPSQLTDEAVPPAAAQPVDAQAQDEGAVDQLVDNELLG